MPDRLLYCYFERMIGRLYKILPLKQDCEETLPSYIDSLLLQMTGVDIVANLSDQPYYLSILGVVAYLKDNILSCDHYCVKKQIFGAIKMCQKLMDIYKGGDACDSISEVQGENGGTG